MELKLAYARSGQGEPLVLLHGFTGSKDSWAHLLPTLTQGREVICVDLPGHGASPLPESTGREGMFQTFEALDRLVDSLGLIRFDLLGYSQGARIALGFTLHAPGRVRRLVLESVNPGLKRSQERALRKAEDENLALSIERDGIPAFVSRWEQLGLFEGVRHLPKDVQSQLRERRLSCAAPGLAGALRCLGLGVQPNYWVDLPTLHVPTLLLTGAEDRKFTDLARKMGYELPQSWRYAFPGVWHTPHLEAPDAYLNEVGNFLAAPEDSVVEKFGT